MFIGAWQLPMPDNESLQVKLTVTLALFQPEPFGDGLRTFVIVGAVLSRLMRAVAVAVFPALSSAVPLTV